MYYERLGEKEKYNQTLEAVVRVSPGYLIKHPEDTYRRMSYAVTLAIMGDSDKAKVEGEKAIELSPNDPIMMYYGACLYSRLNENDRAVELLTDAVNHGYVNFEWIKRDPDFDGIRNESGYIELLKGK